MESGDSLRVGVIAACHNRASDIDTHVVTLAQTIALAPLAGARNTTSLLRPGLIYRDRCACWSREMSHHNFFDLVEDKPLNLNEEAATIPGSVPENQWPSTRSLVCHLYRTILQDTRGLLGEYQLNKELVTVTTIGNYEESSVITATKVSRVLRNARVVPILIN